jgi:hypothetical protein
MTERKPNGLKRLPVNITYKMDDDLELLVSEGYFTDKASIARQALDAFVAPLKERLIFEKGGMEVFKDIGTRKKLREGPGRTGSPGRAGSAGALSSEDLT